MIIFVRYRRIRVTMHIQESRITKLKQQISFSFHLYIVITKGTPKETIFISPSGKKKVVSFVTRFKIFLLIVKKCKKSEKSQKSVWWNPSTSASPPNSTHIRIHSRKYRCLEVSSSVSYHRHLDQINFKFLGRLIANRRIR